MPGVVKSLPGTSISPLAGQPAPKEMLVDLAQLEREYFERRPDVSDPNQMVRFGTSGHGGSPFSGSFNEAHILAITQAICDYRLAHGTDGRGSIAGLFRIDRWAGRHDPCDDPATPGDDDLLAGLYQVEQLPQLVLGLGGSDLVHVPFQFGGGPMTSS